MVFLKKIIEYVEFEKQNFIFTFCHIFVNRKNMFYKQHIVCNALFLHMKSNI